MSLVIKYGGNAMTDPATRAAVAAGVRELAREVPPVLVHGGGPHIAAALDARGIEHRFVRGLRVTTDEAMEVVEAVLTVLGKELASEIGMAAGLTGRDANLLTARRLGDELGRVGTVATVNGTVLAVLRAAGLIPVVASVALEAGGEGASATSLNVNADEVAGAIAGALGEGALFLTNVPGVLEDANDPRSLLSELPGSEARARIADGRISGGMIPKVESALFALGQGAPFAVIADGRHPDGVARALSGSGTRLLPD